MMGTFMKERLKKLWKLQGGYDIMDVDNGFYMVKFELLADREKVVSGGPWMLFDHYLAISRWTPDFVSPEAKVERTLVWIRFPGLNLVFYDESLLLTLATAVGTPVKVDSNTLKVERGRFARVCVEVDLTKPVVGKIKVNGFWQKVQYEGLHIICEACGCYGHYVRQCSMPQKKSTISTVPPAESSSGPTPRREGQQQYIEKVAGKSQQLDANNAAVTGLITENAATKTETEPVIHGDWMIVQRKKRNPSQQKTAAKNNNEWGSYVQHNQRHVGRNSSSIIPKDLTKQNGVVTNAKEKPWIVQKKRRHDGDGTNIADLAIDGSNFVKEKQTKKTPPLDATATRKKVDVGQQNNVSTTIANSPHGPAIATNKKVGQAAPLIGLSSADTTSKEGVSLVNTILLAEPPKQHTPKTLAPEVLLNFDHQLHSKNQCASQDVVTSASPTNEVVVVTQDEDMERVVETPHIWEHHSDDMHQ